MSIPDPISTTVQTFRWAGKEWGIVGVLLMAILLGVGAISYVLWSAHTTQLQETRTLNAVQIQSLTEERKEDKKLIISLTEKTTTALSASAEATKQLSESIEEQNRTLDRLQRSVESPR